METGNQNDIARKVGKSRQWVNRKVGRGEIKALSDGTFDLGKAAQVFANEKTKGKRNGNGNGKPPGLWDEQARLAGHKADIAEMESKKMAGELVEVQVALDEIGKFVSAVRARLLSVAPKIAPAVSKKSTAVCHKIIHGAISEALSEFRHYSPDPGECRPRRAQKRVKKRGGKNRPPARSKRQRVGK